VNLVCNHSKIVHITLNVGNFTIVACGVHSQLIQYKKEYHIGSPFALFLLMKTKTKHSLTNNQGFCPL